MKIRTDDGEDIDVMDIKKIILKPRYKVLAKLENGSVVKLATFFYEKPADKFFRKTAKTIGKFRDVKLEV